MSKKIQSDVQGQDNIAEQDEQDESADSFLISTASTHFPLRCRIRGLVPYIMSNGRLANPLDPIAREIAKIQSKQIKKRTETDFERIADLEWEGSLYLDDDQRVVIPGENIEAALVQAGRKQRKGDLFKAGVLSDGRWPLIYDGPKNIDKLRNDPKFRDFRSVPNKRSGMRIMRTRPIFFPWALDFTLHYLPDLLNESQVVETLEMVGRLIGIGDFKPKYGRFTVEYARP